MKIKEVLDTAATTVLRDRQEEYSQSTATDMQRDIAQVWSVIFDKEITGHDVALAMIALKVIRAKANPSHADSHVDICGYAAIAAQVAEEDATPPARASAPEAKPDPHVCPRCGHGASLHSLGSLSRECWVTDCTCVLTHDQVLLFQKEN